MEVNVLSDLLPWHDCYSTFFSLWKHDLHCFHEHILIIVPLCFQIVKVWSEDGAGKVVEIPADMTARDVCQLLVYKSHCLDDNAWTLVEHHPILGLGKNVCVWIYGKFVSAPWQLCLYLGSFFARIDIDSTFVHLCVCTGYMQWCSSLWKGGQTALALPVRLATTNMSQNLFSKKSFFCFCSFSVKGHVFL